MDKIEAELNKLKQQIQEEEILKYGDFISVRDIKPEEKESK